MLDLKPPLTLCHCHRVLNTPPWNPQLKMSVFRSGEEVLPVPHMLQLVHPPRQFNQTHEPDLRQNQSPLHLQPVPQNLQVEAPPEEPPGASALQNHPFEADLPKYSLNPPPRLVFFTLHVPRPVGDPSPTRMAFNSFCF